MHIDPRDGASIDRIYLHTNEGPQGEGAAQALANYLTTIDGGYHVIVDDRTTVRCAGDDQIVWGEGGDNTHALAICMIGYSATTDWTSSYSQEMVERAAQQVALWCHAYQVPAFHVPAGTAGHAPTERGIAEHADDHDPASQGHTDPGPNFPIDAFVARVQQILAPPVDWPAVARLVAWEARVAAAGLRFGAHGPDVQTMNDLLVHRGYEHTSGDRYGIRAAAAVRYLKIVRGLSNRDGLIFGGAAAHALLT